MEKVIHDEKNGLWYELQGDYYNPFPSSTSARVVVLIHVWVPVAV